MATEKSVKLRVNEDGQFEVVATDPFGIEVITFSRKESREKAEDLLKRQGPPSAPLPQ